MTTYDIYIASPAHQRLSAPIAGIEPQLLKQRGFPIQLVECERDTPSTASSDFQDLVLRVEHAQAVGQPGSHASLMLSREQAKRRVCVSWTDESGYILSFVDPGLKFSERTTAREDAVLRVLREYLDKLQ